MKDQVENLEKKGIADAVYINGLLSPVERAEALARVGSGKACLLYIAPEQLRSKTIEKILMSRSISRFVIDEAHCFSSWGQDFRIEYMYIGEFINNLRQKKGLARNIPVSCFTATAKPKVISDITDYFSRVNGSASEKVHIRCGKDQSYISCPAQRFQKGKIHHTQDAAGREKMPCHRLCITYKARRRTRGAIAQ